MLENPVVFKDSDHLAVWVYLLLHATHKDMLAFFGGSKILLKSGQLITGRKAISSALKVSETKVERVLNLLKSEQQIEQQTCSRNRLITILSWEEYQQSEQQNGQQTDNKRTTNGQQTDTNKNERMKEQKNLFNTIGDTGEKSPVSSTQNKTTQKRKAPALVDEDFLISLESNPAFKGIDIRKEHGKMLAWIETPRGSGKLPTRQRFLNWLNRCTPQDGRSVQGKEEKFDAMDWLKNMNLEEMRNGNN